MSEDVLTAREWNRAGRVIIKGEKARYYRLSDDRTQGRALFTRAQTSELDADPSAEWTVVVDAADWELIKAEAQEVKRRPLVKIRKLEQGCEIWCGPDPDLIRLLQHHGYHFNPSSRYWSNPNKDAETTARAFENGKIRGLAIRVHRSWGQPGEPVL